MIRAKKLKNNPGAQTKTANSLRRIDSMEVIDEKKFGKNLARRVWEIYLFFMFGFIGVLGWKSE